MGNNIFKRKKAIPVQHVEVGGFIVNFFFKENSVVDSYMEIRTISDNWRMRLDARHTMYGYLLTAAQQGLTQQIHGYCVQLYIMATALDQGLINDIHKAIAKYMKRKDKEADSEAKKVTDAQIMADEALMNEAIERGKTQGDKKAERKAAKESQEEIKKEIEEMQSESWRKTHKSGNKEVVGSDKIPENA